ncbi:ergothioneine biosynthesis protein EgtB [Legionella septentrionalis]|uniref:Ergothioneine biosynthesis protein EgtB n=1 Tax=Legionella septentrionalis TaxID=2498109 RepID=A0A433JKJ2_9GAMM|nr:ergothioneine biosynthesis protein EgtB [Legionella septentrionalis]
MLIDRNEVSQQFIKVRGVTENLCKPLILEDYVIQSCEDVSPPKWHLAHTTWFFETFLLLRYLPNYRPFNPQFNFLFNSYYQTVGAPYPRPKRGLLSHPSTAKVLEYRHCVNEAMLDLLQQTDATVSHEILAVILLGLNHEQQHQELLLMDIKHNLSIQPDFPAYKIHSPHNNASPCKKETVWLTVEGGIVEIGHTGTGFYFDNEQPRHRKILQSYALANKLVTNAEYIAFIEDGGYQNPQWWLADGWDILQRNKWEAPLYWLKKEQKWHIFTLQGLQEIYREEPVSHVSYFEADAYARWKGKRLPTEEEWEHFVSVHDLTHQPGNFLESDCLHPEAAFNQDRPQQFMGTLWEWTSSAYLPYPGFKPLAGSLGEYNGKFMNNQMVLRGGSCVTPHAHIRASYRNFFQPDKRWPFTGIRLAKTMEG